MLDSTNLSSMLKDPSLLCTQAYVSGEWINADDGSTFEVKNPARGDVIATVPDMGLAETKRAIEAARLAQKPWAAKTGKERSAILRKWNDLMVENADDLGIILTAEMGKPIAEGKGEILYGASFIEWFAEEAKRVYGETIPGHQVDKRITVIKQPVGVVASITPWNFPNAMITRKVAPALAAGCSFVSRPATETPLSALAIVLLAERAGVPKGVFSVITSKKSSLIGQEFCSNPAIRKLTFTGSTEVGRILMRQSAEQIMKVSMELGGNAPFIVFDDADLDKAVEGALISKYRNKGATGPKVSSFVTIISLVTPVITVGSKNNPPNSWRLPPVNILAPFLSASLMCSSTLSTASELINGPEETPLSKPSPTFILLTASASFFAKAS